MEGRKGEGGGIREREREKEGGRREKREKLVETDVGEEVTKWANDERESERREGRKEGKE
jgi:hypothetical protein